MYDAIIVGGGPAGLSAYIYLNRYGLKTLLLESKFLGGQIMTAHMVENYPGISSIAGFELASNFAKHAETFGDAIKYENVIEVKQNYVVTEKDTYQAKNIILATGQTPRQCGLPNEESLIGHGLSYCATCDGNFYRGKDVAVVGGGNTAITDVGFLSNICNKIYLIHRRDEFRAAKAEVDKALNKSNVVPILNSTITDFTLKDNKLDSLIIKTNNAVSTITVSGLFVAVGAKPETHMLTDLVERDQSGYIITNENMETNINGIYAIGDIRVKDLRQVVTATADGAIASHHIMNNI